MKDYSNSSIDKAAEILDFLSENPQSQSLNQISKSLDIPKASTFRILFSLEKWDMVEKDENEEYRLGKSLIYYGARASKNMNIVTLAKEYIDPFSKEIEESVNLNIEYRQYAVNIYKSTIKESGIVSNLIPISPLNCSGSGKILLAQKSDEEIKAYFQSPNTEERTIYSIMDYEKFEIEKQNLKKHGILYDNEEYEYGLLCIAAPIYLKNQVIAAVSLTGPKRRIQEKGMELLENKLKNVANKISAELQKVGM